MTNIIVQQYAAAFGVLIRLQKAVSEEHKDSVPAPNVTCSYLKHNNKFYCAVVVWNKSKKKTICKAENESPLVAIKECARAFLKTKPATSALASLNVWMEECM